MQGDACSVAAVGSHVGAAAIVSERTHEQPDEEMTTTELQHRAGDLSTAPYLPIVPQRCCDPVTHADWREIPMGMKDKLSGDCEGTTRRRSEPGHELSRLCDCSCQPA